ncbi:unnamed protein product [Linum tenue]|uniref:TIR domain-containing protein n=2 Tax=Linum tenue TaxID=586396 RepID=A0AAV0I9F2_9ROSI|nr:unnamed protein product [Linum tenue]
MAVLLYFLNRSQSSSAKSPLPAGEYEVFLNFRGSDVRYDFADSLHTYLKKYEIRTFFDEEELHKGEEIDSKLLDAIEGSKIYIPIISAKYASSRSPLMELAHMVKCCEKEKGHLILPIFYKVEVGDVKNQRGTFGESFRELAQKHDARTIREWKNALRTVTELKGWTVTPTTRQGVTIDEVFLKARKHLMENYRQVTNQLVGIDSHIEKVKELLNREVQTVGIQGMSGIGKTNIAKAVYDSVSAHFDRCCFVEDVRNILSNGGRIETLQSKIISDILGYDTKVRDPSQGIQFIKDRVCRRKRILIVLDNIDRSFELDTTLGDLANFHPESRFIVTTVDEEILKFFPKCESYKPDLMNDDIALQLFSRHAFGSDYPPTGYMDLSQDFVEVAAGLPLAIKAIGSVVFRKDKKFWVAKLKMFREIPDEQVQKRLKIVYEELSLDEKHIFLDIACYFIGEPTDRPSFLWDDSNLHPLVSIDTLCLKAFIKINERNELWMHDQYKLLGRDIVREEDIVNPWKRSRMWSNKDVLNMLRDKQGTEELKILRVYVDHEDFELTEKEFEKLSGLKYLDVCYGRLSGDFKNVLPDLRWLRLYGCSSIPIDFNLEKLVILDLIACPVRDDWRSWKGIEEAGTLTAINVSACNRMTKVPDLSGCKRLEQIYFRRCPKMRGELHIGDLKDLRVLHVTETNITKLIGDIGRLENLQEINVDNSRLRELSASTGEVPELPTSLKRLTFPSLRVPNLLELKDLEKLWLNCDTLEIPADMWKLSKLKDLSLNQVGFEKHPVGFPISSSPTLPPSLNALSISGYRFEPLERLPSLANLSNLMRLTLADIEAREIAGLGELRMLERFHLLDASNLIDLDGLRHLELLKDLYVSGCLVLTELPSLSNLTKLQVLKINHCPLLSEIQGLGKLESLEVWEIQGCPLIRNQLSDLSPLKQLQRLPTGSNHVTSSSRFLDSLPEEECEILLSCSGFVRDKFGAFLNSLLVRDKMRTFLDDPELHEGERIAPSFVKVMAQSRVYIPILSPGFASSAWCLQVLALMVERYKEDRSRIILPIFYYRNPDDSHEGAWEHFRLKYSDESIRAWKDALKQVADLAGWLVTESYR